MSVAATLTVPTAPIRYEATGETPVADQAGSIELAGTRRRYGRNEEIFAEGEEADFVFKILSGTVRLYRVLADGRRQITAFHFAGDVVGLEPGKLRRMSAETVSDCEIVATPRQTMFHHAEQNNAYARQLWSNAVFELAEAQDHLLLLGRQTATERVVSFLADMAKRQGSRNAVNLAMSRQDIADYLGLTIETVSRTITQLAERGALEIATSRQITLRNGAMRLLDS